MGKVHRVATNSRQLQAQLRWLEVKEVGAGDETGTHQR